jgi:hypothetical protein
MRTGETALPVLIVRWIVRFAGTGLAIFSFVAVLQC